MAKEKNKCSSSPLLITNAVLAAAKVDTALTDRGERAFLAKEAIFKIVESKIFDKIVVADGSNHLLLTDQECWIASRSGVQIEQIAFQQDTEQVILHGKGHGEMQIVDFALKNSTVLKKHQSFYKLSGRYFLKNIFQILKNSEKYPDLFFNNNPKFCLPQSQFTCSAFYKCSIDTYEKYLCQAIYHCNTQRGGRLEAAFFNVLDSVEQSAVSIAFPYFEGVGGTMGTPIQNRFFLARNAYSHLGGLAYTLTNGKT